MVYSANDVHAAYRGLGSGDPAERGSALEYLDNALSAEHRAMVVPLVDDTADDDRVKVAEERYALLPLDFVAALNMMLEGDDMWLRACALYVVGARKEGSLMPAIEANLVAYVPHVREMAEWARLALGTE